MKTGKKNAGDRYDIREIHELLSRLVSLMDTQAIALG
jgi:hypothetical protein